MNAVAPFEHDDAAYVLGLLDDDARRAFERHLESCDECTARVAALTDTTVLLGGLDPSDVELLQTPPEPLPDTTLPLLLRRARSARRRQRATVAGLGLATAACLAALIVAVWPSAAPPHPQGRPLQALSASPLSATATLSSDEHTTTISLTCHYAATSAAGYGSSQYRLLAVDRAGVQHDLGSWTVNQAGATTFATTVNVPVADLTQVLVAPEGQRPVLDLDL